MRIIKSETHENLDAYLINHQTKENIYLLIYVSLPPFHKELEVEKLPGLVLSLHILVLLNGNNLDHVQDYDENDGMM